MLNHIVLMGRLTRDPELKRTNSGISVSSFTIAVDRDYGGEDKVTDFFEIVVWRHTAEFVCRNFAKGRMIVADGKLQTRTWTDKEGGQHRAWEIQADNVYFADSKRDITNGAGFSATTGASYTSPVEESYFSELEEDDGDTLPF